MDELEANAKRTSAADKTHEEQSNDVESESTDLTVPALKVAGELATWTGNSCNSHAQEGIATSILFESPTGLSQTSHLELHNVGPTVIFYSWHKLPLPRPFPLLLSPKKTSHFCFNSSSGVILPGDTQKIDFTFMSDVPGIQTELWQLNTHPVLLQGAPIRVTLRGVALYQDRIAELRHSIKSSFEKIAVSKLCKTIVQNLVKGIRSPERSVSPTELRATEEEEFLLKNPKFSYKRQSVEDLKKLWHKVTPDSEWDLSVGTLRQALLTLPSTKTAEDDLSQNTGLEQLNSILLQLYEPPPKVIPSSGTTMKQVLWRDSLDTLSSEATRLTGVLRQQNARTDKKEEKTEDVAQDHAPTGHPGKGNVEEKRGAPAKGEKFLTTSKKQKGAAAKPKEGGQERDRKEKERAAETEKAKKDEHSEDADAHQQEQAPEDPAHEAMMMGVYTRLFHRKVYGLMDDLVESLCDVTEKLPTHRTTDPGKPKST